MLSKAAVKAFIIVNIIESDLADKYHLHGKKVLLCVGTIHERKNQRQIVRAFRLLPQDLA